MVGDAAGRLHPSGVLLSGFGCPSSLTSTTPPAWDVGPVLQLYALERDRGDPGRGRLTTVLSILGGLRLRDDAVPRSTTLLFYVFLLGLVIPDRGDDRAALLRRPGIGLIDTYWALILPGDRQLGPFGIFWMRAFLSAPRR